MSAADPYNPSPEAAPWRFASTHWSLVLAARQRPSPEAEAALTTLCRIYWYPLYAYARRHLARMEDAQDLTQGFFAQFLEKDYLQAADPERGKFRSFLLTAFKHFLASGTIKRLAEFTQNVAGHRRPLHRSACLQSAVEIGGYVADLYHGS